MSLRDFASPGRTSQISTPNAFLPQKQRSSKSRQSSIYHHHQPFTVAHQLVNVGIDLSNASISGYTNITIIPTDAKNRIIKLDARYMNIKNVYVNDHKVNYLYNDTIYEESEKQLNILDLGIDDKVFEKYTIAQYQLYQNKFNYLFSGTDTKELTIFLPDKMKITLNDASTLLNGLTPIARDSPGSYRTPNNVEMIYTPIVIKIEYSCKNPLDGVCFHGGLHKPNIPKENWHAYTTNSLLGVSTSSWVPCVDNLWERCTWKLEFTSARTVGDLVTTDPFDDDLESMEEINKNDDEIDVDREIVVCVSDLFHVKEDVHLLDNSKKVTSFTIFNPVSPHHIGWAVGPFEKISLESLEDNDEDFQNQDAGNNNLNGTSSTNNNNEEVDSNIVKGVIYCLKDKKEEAINTCIFLSKAIDFFSREFGSFPFSSYSVVFVNDSPDTTYSFSGLTIHSEKLLYGPSVIDPIFETTELLISALSRQWSGINVLPRTYDDFWITIGISLYMTNQFIKQLMGHNEFKFRMKKRAEMICEQDIGRPPIADPHLQFPINENKDLDFIKLKAPVILFILNRRMTKTDKSFGLSRVIPKIFLEAMSGDLPNGGIDAIHFQHVTEKVNHNKLEYFFKQWIFGAGTPIFRITHRFNKKRMFIEMGIRQVQLDEVKPRKPTIDNFLDDANRLITNVDSPPVQNTFVGPMTIRIHEADGTPYEHIVNLKDNFTKLDIQYNTKYKRLKRRNIKNADNEGGEENGENEGENDDKNDDEENNNSQDILKRCLGNILESPEDVRKWGLSDWSKEQEEKMANDAFEWIRVDADFEWICRIHITQPDYMFLSQLQQDRDVEAQYESVKYFCETPHPIPVYSTILLRTFMDSRYYYGVRIEAAKALVAYAKKDLEFVGLKFLIKAFQTLFCFDTKSNIPLPNDFSNFPLYFVQKSLPKIMASIRDENNKCPIMVKNFLFDLLRYNENGQNDFVDSFFLSEIVKSIVSVIIHDNKQLNKSQEDEDYLKKVLLEIDRLVRMDDWMPSYHHLTFITILGQKVELAMEGLLDMSYENLLIYTKSSYYDDIRVLAIEGIIKFGGLKNKLFLHYLFKLLEFDSSYYFKSKVIELLGKGLAIIGIDKTLQILDDEEFEPEDPEQFDGKVLSTVNNGNINSEEHSGMHGSGMVIIEDEAVNEGIQERRTAIEKSSIIGIIEFLRESYGKKGKGLIFEFWKALQSPVLGINHKKSLFDICSILFDPTSSLLVSLSIPRDKMIVAKNNGNGKVTLFRQNKFKIQFNKKIALKILTKMNNNTNNNNNETSKSSGKTPKTPARLTLDTKAIKEINDSHGNIMELQTPVVFESPVTKSSQTVKAEKPKAVKAEISKAVAVNVSLSPISGKKTVINIKSPTPLKLIKKPKVFQNTHPITRAVDQGYKLNKHNEPSRVIKIKTSAEFLKKRDALLDLKAQDRKFIRSIRSKIKNSDDLKVLFNAEVRRNELNKQIRFVKINFKTHKISIDSRSFNDHHQSKFTKIKKPKIKFKLK